jgi:hypothetical protein
VHRLFILLIFIICYRSVVQYAWEISGASSDNKSNQTTVGYNFARANDLDRISAINSTVSAEIDLCITDGESTPHHLRFQGPTKERAKPASKTDQTTKSSTGAEKLNPIPKPAHTQTSVPRPEKPQPKSSYVSLIPDDDRDDENDGEFVPNNEVDHKPVKPKCIVLFYYYGFIRLYLYIYVQLCAYLSCVCIKMRSGANILDIYYK